MTTRHYRNNFALQYPLVRYRPSPPYPRGRLVIRPYIISSGFTTSNKLAVYHHFTGPSLTHSRPRIKWLMLTTVQAQRCDVTFSPAFVSFKAEDRSLISLFAFHEPREPNIKRCARPVRDCHVEFRRRKSLWKKLLFKRRF